MLKRTLITVGITAILLTGVIPVGDACGLAAAADHSCCADVNPEPTPSCCSSSEDGDRTTAPNQELGCDCAHPVGAPVTILTPIPPQGPDHALSVVLASDTLHLSLLTDGRVQTLEHRGQTHPPPPIFLLDCSFLI